MKVKLPKKNQKKQDVDEDITTGLIVFMMLNNVKATQKKRCLKRTAHTSKCWIHLANEDNLRIKPSNIQNAGKGLISWKKPFKRSQIIDKYTGEKTTLKKLDAKYGKKSSHNTAYVTVQENVGTLIKQPMAPTVR